MSTPLFSSLIYLLGFVGLVAIGLLPLRAWQVLVNVFKDGASQLQRKVLAAFTVLVVVAALWSDVRIAVRIFRCLTETYCGPGIASGWTYLATLGVVYVFFEVAIFMLNKIGQAKTTPRSAGF